MWADGDHRVPTRLSLTSRQEEASKCGPVRLRHRVRSDVAFKILGSQFAKVKKIKHRTAATEKRTDKMTGRLSGRVAIVTGATSGIVSPRRECE